MTQGFDEWYVNYENKHEAYAGTIAVDTWNARQAEIDALSTLNEMLEQKIDDLVLRNIELQKRVDATHSWLNFEDIRHSLVCDIVDHANDILKGESNE